MTEETEDDQVTPELGELTELCRDLVTVLGSLRTQLREAVATGLYRLEGIEQARGTDKLLSDARHWLKLAGEAQKQLLEIEKRKAGISDGYALDLEAAGEEIRCRLDRLRGCCGAGESAG
ncbi:hypothetical protein [Litorisediminicola beolgyonensis]|uniref:Uncharacterized protein n=1 Tax=Litorisediminicola beolgyonensis TaxID=1173614 RepID=A0ABW3ZN10_9RHOB